MLSDLKDSIKARLYDIKYTPFLASYTFFWIFWNAKLIMIFTSDKLSIQNKIDMMAYNDIDIINPLLFALVYTIIFPIFTAFFYYITLQYRRLMNYIQQQIEDVTPLTQKKANEIRTENANLRIELDSKIEELNNSQQKYKEKKESLISLYDEKTKELNSGYDEKLKKETSKIQTELQSAYGDITDKNTLIGEQTKTIEVLQNKIKVFETEDTKETKKSTKESTTIGSILETINEDKKKLVANLNEDEITLLKLIYDNDLPHMNSSTYINKILEVSELKRVKVQSLLTSLSSDNKGILSLSNGIYDTTDKGRNIMLELFEKE